MSGNNYQQYGGNPYGAAEAGYGTGASNPTSSPASNPYGSTGYGSSNPYGGEVGNRKCARQARPTDATE